jgi:glycerate kinase
LISLTIILFNKDTKYHLKGGFMKIVIAPDSYKGSLSALDVGKTMRQAISNEIIDAEIEVLPMADGGEGTLDALVFATNGAKEEIEVTGPLGDKVRTYYGVLGDEATAVIEMAAIAGLPMVPKEKRNPMLTTTYGIGEAIVHALEKGYRHFKIGLGGSATNDGGLGMLQALGVQFLNETGQAINPIGASLGEIKSVNFDTLHKAVLASQFEVASDVKNPLCGPTGASFIFGPQKGGTPEQLQMLDEAMLHYANLIEKCLNKVLKEIPGAGAAGGLGFAFLTIEGELKSGASIVGEALGLEEKIKKADWVITGEGQSDSQTLYGKVPFYVAKMAKKYNVPTILISGSLGEGIEQLYDYFLSCHSIVSGPMSLEKAMSHADKLLTRETRNVARLLMSSYKSNGI